MRTALAAIVTLASPIFWTSTVSAQSSAPESEKDIIVVLGEAWEDEREKIEDQSKMLIRPTRTSHPVARYFDSFCVTTWNVADRFASVIEDRINANARDAGAQIAEEGCLPNALVAIVQDSATDFERLKDEHGFVFGDLKNYELARAEKSAGAVRSWNVVESRGRDGRPFQTVAIGIDGGTGGGRSSGASAALNQQTSGSRLTATVRRDMIMSVVIFDINEINGTSLTQLADFATMRLLAETYEPEEAVTPKYPTVLSLFSDIDGTPAGLSRFDKAMLKGLYSLHPTARDTAIYEATSSAYRKLLVDEQRVSSSSAE